MQRVLVTGATGFVGSHLVRRLARTDISELRAAIHKSPAPGDWPKRVDTLTLDFDDRARLEDGLRGIDTVFHLAGKVHDHAERNDSGAHHAVTFNGTQRLFEAARQSGARRLVFVSSLAVYGAGSRAVRDEDDPCEPDSPYGRAKLEAERWLAAESRQSGPKVSCLRPAMVYGSGAKGNLPRMIRMMQRGLFPPPPEVGARRSVLHVGNLVEACILAATSENAAGETYIVTDPHDSSTRELYDLIRGLQGKRPIGWQVPHSLLRFAARTGDMLGALRGRRFPLDSEALDKLLGEARFSSAKICHALGYAPRLGLVDGLGEMLA